MCTCAGVPCLRRLALFGCCTYVAVPGGGWDRLRQLEQLEIADGDGSIDDESYYMSGTSDGSISCRQSKRRIRCKRRLGHWARAEHAANVICLGSLIVQPSSDNGVHWNM